MFASYDTPPTLPTPLTPTKQEFSVCKGLRLGLAGVTDLLRASPVVGMDEDGARHFARVRSYLQTAAKQGENLLGVLAQLFTTGAWLPAGP